MEKKLNIKKILSNYALYFIMILMVLVIGSMSPKFFSWRVLRDILMQSSTRIIVALGCLFILISGSADLSGGRTVGLAAVIAGSLAQFEDVPYTERAVGKCPRSSRFLRLFWSACVLVCSTGLRAQN